MGSDDSKTIQVACPVPECGCTKEVSVPKYLMEKKIVGTLKIQIHRGVCCPHEFIVFIDRKGVIRGYENIDMSIDLAEYAGRTIGAKIYLRDLLNKFREYAIGSILHGIILKVPIVILRRSDEKSRSTEINTLLNEFLPEKQRIPMIVSTIEEKDYKSAKIDDALVLSPDGLVANTPWSDIPLNYESDLMRKALDILDDEGQAIIIEQEIEYLFKKVEYVNEEIKKIVSIYEDDLKDLIKREFHEQNVSDYDIMLYKQVVKFRYKGPIEKIKIRSFSKLKEGLW